MMIDDFVIKKTSKYVFVLKFIYGISQLRDASVGLITRLLRKDMMSIAME